MNQARFSGLTGREPGGQVHIYINSDRLFIGDPVPPKGHRKSSWDLREQGQRKG